MLRLRVGARVGSRAAACARRQCELCCCWLIGAVVVLQEVLEEGKSAVSLEEVHEIAIDAVHSIKDACARGRSCLSSCGGRCLRCVNLWGRESGGRRGGCSSIGYHRARCAGSVGRWGEIEVESL
jgi:hypothetical protein